MTGVPYVALECLDPCRQFGMSAYSDVTCDRQGKECRGRGRGGARERERSEDGLERGKGGGEQENGKRERNATWVIQWLCLSENPNTRY